MGESKRQYIPLFFDVINSKLFRKISGDSLKLYFILRRYVCRSRSEHSLSLFYINGYLATSGYLGTYAKLFGKSDSTISRWLKELEECGVIFTYRKGREDRPSIWVLGRVIHVEGSEHGTDIFFLDHLAIAQEEDQETTVTFDDAQMKECEAPEHTELNSTLSLLQVRMQARVQRRMQGSNREDIIDKTNISPRKSARPPADLEYVDLEDLEEVTRPKWQIPETFEQEAFLAVCKAKWFKAGQKTKVKALLKAYEAGKVLGDHVYEECARVLEDMPELDKVRLPPMPMSWHKWRAEQATSHRWSVDGFIKSLLNRDALMQHCRYHMKELGREAGRMEGGVYVIDIPEDGPR